MPVKLTNEDFIAKAIAKHGNKYDYSEINYINATTPIKIICKEHGEFWQVAYYHLNGNACKHCAFDRFGDTRRKSTEEFIRQSRLVHGDYYDYSKVVYKKGRIPVTIICPKHGPFEQAPTGHQRGARCPLCYRSSHLREVFLEKVKFIHSDKYDYSLITKEFVVFDDKLQIICPKHGVFVQEKRQHIIGRGCPHPGCARCPSSALEKQWIESFRIPTMLSPHRLTDIKLSVDGYDPSANTVYEFYGDFWHGNPKVFSPYKTNPVIKATFGKIYEKTMLRETKIKNAGYKLVTIWELDWLQANGLKTHIRL